ncbi:abortive infection family protein [Candidatus Saccharibacteria bacterium]|nr:abortive infection family protein [Candidatus Saccharibacteria bacterium]
MDNEELHQTLKDLESLLIDYSTGGPRGEEQEDKYTILRDKLLKYATTKDQELKKKIPESVTTYRTLNSFWNFIKNKYSHYSERREHIYMDFSSVFSLIESRQFAAQDDVIEDDKLLGKKFEEDVAKIKVLLSDGLYDSAITASRTLVQKVETWILAQTTGADPESNLNADNLHKKTMVLLKLDSSKDYDKRLKMIITGLNQVNSGIAQIRNVASDAHTPKYKAERHHAILAVNSAITMCRFLLDSMNYQKKE